MNWLDKLMGTPTPQSVARDMAAALRARGATDVRTDLARLEIAFQAEDHASTLYLGNLLHELRRCPRAERPSVLQRYLEVIYPDPDRHPRSYEAAQPLLMPVLRRRADIGNFTLKLGEAGDAAPQDGPVFRPFMGDLVIALVCDSATSMSYVNGALLASWGVDFDRALADALHNLRGLPEAGGWQAMGDGVWLGHWGDSYDSSRILLPDLIHRVGVRDPVAAVPFRDAVLLTHAGNEAGLAAMARTIGERAMENGRWLSFAPLRLDGTQWQPWAPDTGLRDWQLLGLRNLAEDYAGQKGLLEARHQKTGTDIFVATYQVLARPDGRLHSFAVWGDGVDCLLPLTDLLILARKEAGELIRLTLPWADAAAIVGDLLEPDILHPPRFRARRFPAPEMLARLAERALPD